ncbi:hypothetical protein Rahaq_2814 [Rahnella aceris]|jgi:hypothetical protein|uniref:Uncharacterized protein n=1 Tax=Rahnella sp. (strain Y9602) TaxID=2703885 RepID=A0A0H3FHP9_RAHSY|nr:hypothetical protein Rahaq_2814 [Rahnella aceris]MDP9707609.1 hypothetical protein [Rahnella aquatilis]RKT89697.1 hypothetical protein BJ925_0133 [Rahnella aquatilis]CAH0197692.1 hypothetical protein SRABI106_01456 [Rahnella aquatilis]
MMTNNLRFIITLAKLLIILKSPVVNPVTCAIFHKTL